MSRERAPDFVLIGVVATLCGIGLTMILSASSATAGSYAMLAYFWQQQCTWLAVGLLCALIAYHVPLRALRVAAPWLLAAAAVALVIPFVPHAGLAVNGAHRWILAGRLSLQPSEFAKLAVVLAVAAWLARRSPRRLRFSRLLTGIAPVALVGALVLAEPDVGTAAIIGTIAFVLLFVGGVRLWQLGAIGFAGVAAVGALALRHASWMTRLTIFLDPWRDPRNAGFHIIQSLYALGSGGVTGVGLGASSEKFFYLPEQYTDFIFSVLGEELGIVGTVCVVALFLLIAYRAYRIAAKSPDRFGRLLALGCASMIVVQAFVNIGVVTSSLPVTGVPLPFISFGGSSLVANLIAVALILNVGTLVRVNSAVARRRRLRVIDGSGGGAAPARDPLPVPPHAAARAGDAIEPSSRRFEALWEIERAILDASYAFETSVHAPSEAYSAWLAARTAASRFGEVFQANCMVLPEHVTPDLVQLHRRFTEIFQAYFRYLVTSNGDTRLAYARARANGDLVLGDISRCLEVVEAALRHESSGEALSADHLAAFGAARPQPISAERRLRHVPRNGTYASRGHVRPVRV